MGSNRTKWEEIGEIVDMLQEDLRLSRSRACGLAQIWRDSRAMPMTLACKIEIQGGNRLVALSNSSTWVEGTAPREADARMFGL